MDRAVIEQRIESLRYCVGRCSGDARDADAQDIIALNLSRAVQQCVDIGAHLIARSNVAAPDNSYQDGTTT